MTEGHKPTHQDNPLAECLNVNVALKAAGLGVREFDPVTNLLNWDDCCQEWFGLATDNQLPFEQAIQSIHPDDVDWINQASQC